METNNEKDCCQVTTCGCEGNPEACTCGSGCECNEAACSCAKGCDSASK
ncbi:MAG: hypothetical protein H0V17_30040 [Deltaproteobacteria bacterium]|nr:hypothetical protein [Deltaproteobacteria bacterium]